MRSLRGIAGAAGLGAVISYFLDPDQGRRRRKMTVDRVGGLLRRGERKAEQGVHAVAAEAVAMKEKSAAAARPDEAPGDDNTLVQKIRSEVFRDASIPTGNINIDAADGVVTLRGQVDDPHLIRRLEKDIAGVAGVKEVKNLLHPPGTPAPNLEAVSSS